MRKLNQVSIIAVLITCNFFAAVKAQTKNQQPIQVSAKPASNIATQWMHFITEQAKKEGLLPPPSLRLYAYTGLALYEAVAPGKKNYQSLYSIISGRKIVFNPKNNYHLPTCANTALAALLRKLTIIKSIRAVDSMENICQSGFQ